MELTGKIIAVLPVREGVSERGAWKSQDYVMERQSGNYVSRMAFTVRDGESGRIARLGIAVGKLMTVYFDIDAREYQGKWYNTITAYDAREVSADGAHGGAAAQGGNADGLPY